MNELTMTLYKQPANDEKPRNDGQPQWALDDADTLRRQLKFRCWHRGTKEVDILLGGFIDKYMHDLAVERLHEMAALLECPDNDIYNWVTGGEDPTPQHDTQLMKLIRKHVQENSSQKG